MPAPIYIQGFTKSNHPLYHTWMGMIARCENPNNASYKNYGGRGLSVCDRWRHSFEKFVEDMGPKPNGYTIERVDNDEGYNPTNCIWDTRKNQNNNRRDKATNTGYSGISYSESKKIYEVRHKDKYLGSTYDLESAISIKKGKKPVTRLRTTNKTGYKGIHFCENKNIFIVQKSKV